MKRGLAYNLILLFVFPVLSFWAGLKNQSINNKRLLITLFITIIGSTFVFPEEADSTRHLIKLEQHYIGLTFTEFADELYDIILLKPQPDTNDDPYLHILSFISGSLLNSSWMLYVMASFVYGYFYSGAVLKLFANISTSNRNYFFIYIALVFLFWKSVDGINSIRTWTGAWVMFNGVLGYVFYKKKRYLYLVLFSPLIHVAYLLMSIPVWIGLMIKPKPYLYSVIFFASFFVSLNQSTLVNQFSQSDLGQDKVKAYYKDADYWEDRDEDTKNKQNWYKYYGETKANFYALNLFSIFFIIYGIFIKKMSNEEKTLFSIALLLVTLANLADFIPAVYNRTMINSGLYTLATMLLVIKDEESYQNTIGTKSIIKYSFILSSLLLIVFLIFQFSGLIIYISMYIFAFPFLPIIVNDSNISIREFIAWFI